jgi:hypothetical protein
MYLGTALTEKADADQINRALLDLLKKINELSERIERLENAAKNN